jgi:hypothetical protein
MYSVKFSRLAPVGILNPPDLFNSALWQWNSPNDGSWMPAGSIMYGQQRLNEMSTIGKWQIAKYYSQAQPKKYFSEKLQQIQIGEIGCL